MFDKGEKMLPSIERQEHEVESAKEVDVTIKVGKFSLFFQNYYTIISLTNDILTGVVYLTGSVFQLLEWQLTGISFFILGSFFLLMRPILKIIHNIQVQRQQEKKNRENNLSNDTGTPKSKEETGENYNEEYYGDETKSE